jgi:hypothetical protein
MQRIDELLRPETILESIAKCETYGELDSETRANIRGIHMMFEKLKKTPDMIRIMLQIEFQFEGVVNACDKKADHEYLLSDECEWYDSTFVIPQYSCVKQWVTKCVSEMKKGKKVVCLVPCRTNTEWFHEIVLRESSDVRFIKGRVTLPGYPKQNQFPDAVCVFLPDSTKQFKSVKTKRPVAIIKCNMSFTSNKTTFEKVQ